MITLDTAYCYTLEAADQNPYHAPFQDLLTCTIGDYSKTSSTASILAYPYAYLKFRLQIFMFVGGLCSSQLIIVLLLGLLCTWNFVHLVCALFTVLCCTMVGWG